MIRLLKPRQETRELKLVTNLSYPSKREQNELTEKYVENYVIDHEMELRRNYNNKFLAFSLDEGIIDSDTNFRTLAGRILQMPGKVLEVQSKPGKLVLIRHVDSFFSMGGLKRV